MSKNITMRRLLCICMTALIFTVMTLDTRVTAYIYPENFAVTEQNNDKQSGISHTTMIPLASAAILYLAIGTAAYSVNGAIYYQREQAAYGKLDSYINVSEFEHGVFRLTNIERVRHGLPLLIWDDNLADIARAHSRDLAYNDIFDHIGSDGSDGGVRLARSGIKYRLWAENLSGGINSPEAAVKAWMNSPEHRVNILNGNLTHLGVGFYHTENSEWLYYAAQKFVLFRPAGGS